jgi:hypothetical protein
MPCPLASQFSHCRCPERALLASSHAMPAPAWPEVRQAADVSADARNCALSPPLLSCNASCWTVPAQPGPGPASSSMAPVHHNKLYKRNVRQLRPRLLCFIATGTVGQQPVAAEEPAVLHSGSVQPTALKSTHPWGRCQGSAKSVLARAHTQSPLFVARAPY